MNELKTYLLVLVIITGSVFVSCVKDVDFNQAEDVMLTPVFEADFIYSKVAIDELGLDIDPSVILPEVIIRDTLDYDLLGTDFVIENLEEVVLTFEFKNTIERNFEFAFEFLSEGNQRIGPLYFISVNSGTGIGFDPTITTENITLNKAIINELATAVKLASSIRVENVSSSLSGMLELRSKATYYINYIL